MSNYINVNKWQVTATVCTSVCNASCNCLNMFYYIISALLCQRAVLKHTMVTAFWVMWPPGIVFTVPVTFNYKTTVVTLSPVLFNYFLILHHPSIQKHTLRWVSFSRLVYAWSQEGQSQNQWGNSNAERRRERGTRCTTRYFFFFLCFLPKGTFLDILLFHMNS